MFLNFWGAGRTPRSARVIQWSALDYTNLLSPRYSEGVDSPPYFNQEAAKSNFNAASMRISFASK